MQWLAAVRATYFEKKQTANGGTPMLNSDGEEIDLLQQELEKVGHADPTHMNEESMRERTSSLALTIGSEGGIEQEKLLAQYHALKNLSNSSKFTSDSTMNSGKTTPTLTEKRRRHLFRSATASATPPSLTDESSSLKNHSFT